MKKINLITLIMLLSCSDTIIEKNKIDNAINTVTETSKQVETGILNDELFVFKTNNISLLKNELRNNLKYPCTAERTKDIQSISQLPGSNYYFFNDETVKKSFTFQCDEESIIYPIGMGIIIDVERNRVEDIWTQDMKFKHYFDRMINELGYLPNDFKRILYKNYIMIDHGYYFAENFRALSIYTNLKNIPENIKVGMEATILTELGFIDNEGVDVLSTTLLTNADNKLEVQKDIINFEVIFEKDEKFYFIGEGIVDQLTIESFNNIFE
jgi:hypothetical protein|tara:strand:+ start:3342 stop:4148 length:807 start_codon:yes stop_codon:yes gene_type:complete